MRLLLDTHILLWAALGDARLSATASHMLLDDENTVHFSAASIWEVAIKSSLKRDDFRLDAAFLRRELLDHDYVELAVTGEHASAVGRLPPVHKDPFDRMLVAQATVDGLTLLTADAQVAAYPGPVRLV